MFVYILISFLPLPIEMTSLTVHLSLFPPDQSILQFPSTRRQLPSHAGDRADVQSPSLQPRRRGRPKKQRPQATTSTTNVRLTDATTINNRGDHGSVIASTCFIHVLVFLFIVVVVAASDLVAAHPSAWHVHASVGGLDITFTEVVAASFAYFVFRVLLVIQDA